MIVFITAGIWHGANLTFLLWGMLHGICMCVETLIFSKKKDGKKRLPAPFGWIATMFIVVIGFVIFRADSVTYGISYIGRMFAFDVSSVSSAVTLSILTPVMIFTLVAAFIACCPVVQLIGKKTENTASGPVWSALSYVLSVLLFTACIMTLAADSYNPFIYFRF